MQLVLVKEGRETLFDNVPVTQDNLWISCTDRAYIIFRQILKFGPCFNAPVGFSSFFIIDVVAHGTDIACRTPFVKSPLANLAFSLEPAYRADVGIRQIFKSCALRYSIVRFAPERRVDISAKPAFVSIKSGGFFGCTFFGCC